MDRNSNREESPKRGAEGPEPPVLPVEPEATDSNSKSVFVADNDLGAAPPVRNHQRPTSPCQDSPNNRPGPSRWAASSPRSKRPPLTLRQKLDVSPSSVTKIGSYLQETYPQFSATTRRNTRNFLLKALIQVRELHPIRNSDAGWARLLAYLTNFGPYSTEDKVHLAWQLAFEQPPYAHFRSLWNRGLEHLRAALPEDNNISSADLIRF